MSTVTCDRTRRWRRQGRRGRVSCDSFDVRGSRRGRTRCSRNWSAVVYWVHLSGQQTGHESVTTTRAGRQAGGNQLVTRPHPETTSTAQQGSCSGS